MKISIIFLPVLMVFTLLSFSDSAFANVSVSIPSGTGVLGCEKTNDCYIPESISITAGETVRWTNDDTFAHTVTSGSPADGPSGVFDSGLVMAGADYTFTFNDKGSYEYFCMVHPWMAGSVFVTAQPKPTECGPGTKLVNGICQSIPREQDGDPRPRYEWVILGVIGVGIVGGIFMMKKKRSSGGETVQTVHTASPTSSKSGRTCNVCGTNISEGVDACPSCGDMYS